MKDLIIYTTPIFLAVLGFIFNQRITQLKASTETSLSIKAEHYRAEIEYVSNKLTSFLNPIIYSVNFDSAIWKKLSTLSNADDTFSEDLSREIERNHLLPNLINARHLIVQGLHYVDDNNPFYHALIQFVCHVSVYEALRESGENANPIDVGFPFPANLKALITEEFSMTNQRYKKLIQSPEDFLRYSSSKE